MLAPSTKVRRVRVRGRRAFRVSFLVTALAATVAFVAPPSTAVGTCNSPPQVFPVANLTPGMTATGQTVIQGSTPTSFDVEILGVLQDGIAPGIDFILAQITGPPSFLQATGGIVAGMSGSPVKASDGRLIGSTSYGFFAADQTLMGITPAESMAPLFDYPRASTAAGPKAVRLARSVQLTPSLQRVAARAAGISVANVGVARQLRVPLAVSGLQSHFGRLKQAITRLHLPVVLYRAAATPAGVTPATMPLAPGDGFSAALSYGDLTLAGIGTTTAVCGNLALAFGHPFAFAGRIHLGMSGADVLTVIKDPSQIFGGYKLANVTDLHGTVDQDRLAGIRGIEGDLPGLVPVVATIVNPDLDKVRTGTTSVVSDVNLGPFSDDLGTIGAFHLLNDEDVVFDRIGDGSVSLQWVVKGTGPSGAPFTLRRDDKYFSEYDASFESIFELLDNIEAIKNNSFGRVTFHSVKIVGQITQEHIADTIKKVLSSSPLQHGLKDRRTLRVRPGDVIHLRVVLKPESGGGTRKVNLTMLVPNSARRFGEVDVSGGQPPFCGGGFFFFGGSSSNCGAKSFAGLIGKLANGERNSDLVAHMFTQRKHGSIRQKTISSQSPVILGFDFIRLRIAGRSGKGGAGSIPPPIP